MSSLQPRYQKALQTVSASAAIFFYNVNRILGYFGLG